MSEQVDPEAYRERLERITELYSSMMTTVGDLSTRRCPYKNRFDQCTAKFGCRNQRKPEVAGGLMQCGGDDKIDYRSAWDTE
ncbi:MAG: hypothetical protein QOD65_737 [Gaiellales bacterium]|jgi:hypothetical protein|nr:hypothetical protein [Gaiellales bacterium]MDX6597628.1 hypothetical protein [Gaiellales bacterium]